MAGMLQVLWPLICGAVLGKGLQFAVPLFSPCVRQMIIPFLLFFKVHSYDEWINSTAAS